MDSAFNTKHWHNERTSTGFINYIIVCMLFTIIITYPSYAQQSAQNTTQTTNKTNKTIGIVDGCKSFKDYENWLSEYGLAYKIISSPAEADSCGIILFCGGPDLGINPERDLLDSLVFEECKNKNIPIFGICRGMQIVCFFMGAELIEDLGELNIKHQKTSNGKSRYHTLILSTGEQWRVNSRHHQAVKNVPFECSLTGKSPEGIWELLVAADGSKMLVQCHPERPEMRGSEIEKASINYIKSKLE